MKIFSLLACYFFFISINLLEAQDYTQKVNSYFDELLKNEKLFNEDINWKISSQHKSSISNVDHFYFYQTYNSIEIYNSLSSIHIQNNGKIIKSNNNFIKNCSSKIKDKTPSKLTAIDVIQLISKKNDYSLTQPLKILNQNNSEFLISNGGISEYDIPSKLVYINYNDELILAWMITILDIDKSHWWDYFVQANTGDIIFKNDNVFNCISENNSIINTNKNLPSNSFRNSKKNSFSDDSYEVLPMPLESPYFGERSIVVNPVNYFSSPLGWHSKGELISFYDVTKGNNINAFIGNGDMYEYQPNGGINLSFTDYEFNQNFNNINRYENAAITNLFYWGNIIHDVLYSYGFDEASGNFQVNNFNSGGLDNDEVIILGQQDLNLCNASIGISRDGVKPFISINVCGDKDGAFDNIVIIHEYIHGLSFRLTGGSTSGNCLTSGEQMTEGWADWYALMMTMSPNDIPSKPRGIANYLFNQGENGDGIRDYPYTTDMNINPQTYWFIKFEQGTHQVGSVWAAMLWEITWVLIEEFGYDENIYNFSGNIELDAGNIIALAIVTEGMKLQPCEPGFVDARDAIFTAFKSIYGSEYDCLIWEAFAKRGLGYLANQGNSGSLTDGIESFDMPPNQAIFDNAYNNICVNTDEIFGLNGGFPTGGFYSGPGVIDDGNGLTFSFRPSEVGVGDHVIFYEVYDGLCTVASVDEATIEVIADDIFPEIICINDLVYTIPYDEDYFMIPDFSNNILANDNCATSPIITQNPVAGVNIEIGETVIVMTVKDGAGNETSCSFNITVKKLGQENENYFEIYPNPITKDLIISSKFNIVLLKANIFDINGRLIQTFSFNDFGLTKIISIENFASGLYFLSLETKGIITVKRILKE